MDAHTSFRGPHITKGGFSTFLSGWACYTGFVEEGIQQTLIRSFGVDALEWRVTTVSEDGTQAKVRPQLKYASVLERLDDALGKTGWSNHYDLSSEAAVCKLSIGGVTKSELVNTSLSRDAATCAHDALVYAAERFGLVPPAEISETYWVDYDLETQTILHEPNLTPKSALLTPPLSEKPAGQQAIDRLVERLRQEGKGLEAAKLVMNYGGYGEDAEAARELYSKLRALLLEKDGALPL